MAVETLAAFRAADKGMNVQPIVVVTKGTDGEIYVAESDPATGGLVTTTTLAPPAGGFATETTLTLIKGYVDGLETLVTSTNTKLDTLAGYVDGIETLLAKIPSGLVKVAFDYVSGNYAGATTDVWTYKTGGSGGTTVATVTITYVDATKAQISTVGVA